MVFTVIQHQALAAAWARWNGQRGTEKQALRIMRRLTAEVLHRLLSARGVVVSRVPDAAEAR